MGTPTPMPTPTTSSCPTCCSALVSQHPSETASRCVTARSVGRHRFIISDYRLTKGLGPGNHITSLPFSVGGYEWAIKCFPDGDKPENADHISLFIAIHSGGVRTWSVRAEFTMALVDNLGKQSPSFRWGPATFTAKTYSWGYSRFLRRAKIEATSYVGGDCLVIQCDVSVLHPPCSEDVPNIRLALPPSCELHRHLGRLLDGGEGADVTFQVGDDFFPAHRCVLAARSPVFRAELFGPMQEARMQLIKIEDVEPAIFDALLRFIYTESLPSPMLEELVDAKGLPSIATARRLFAAADRYDVERLKLLCEHKLCRDMDVDNVAATFDLADRHHCTSLKAACINFIAASPETLFAVIKLHGWIRLLQDDQFSLPQKPLKQKKKKRKKTN